MARIERHLVLLCSLLIGAACTHPPVQLAVTRAQMSGPEPWLVVAALEHVVSRAAPQVFLELHGGASYGSTCGFLRFAGCVDAVVVQSMLDQAAGSRFECGGGRCDADVGMRFGPMYCALDRSACDERPPFAGVSGEHVRVLFSGPRRRLRSLG